VIAAGVPASNIMIYEQYGKFLAGTRVTDKALVIDPEFPAGIKTHIHENSNAAMASISVAGTDTKYVSAFMDATCVINVSQIKDHSICGYTGTMKNITHGSIINPHDFHAHNASPQIAQLARRSEEPSACTSPMPTRSSRRGPLDTKKAPRA
jgi:uncharacterized Fe-S center protein